MINPTVASASISVTTTSAHVAISMRFEAA